MTHDEPRVFISYRRDDAGGHAGRLFDHLVAQLGKDHVFMDVEAIAPGADFVVEIKRAIAECDALIAIIGPRWFAQSPDGTSRLHDPDDFVRLEITAALAAGVPLIPTLVDGASMPSIDGLPGEIASLARRNAVGLDNARWYHDVERLMDAIRPGSAGVTCPSCGKDNPAGFAFCGFCSAPIEPAVRTPQERRVVSVVSCSLFGASRGDPESARSRLITYRAQVAAVIEHFGGTIQPGSGEEVLCIFGAPNAHEDDSERAIRAGLRIAETFSEFSSGGSHATSLIPTIAVDSGDVLAGVDSGGDLEVTGEVIGSVPLLRSGAPPGSVVVGATAHQATATVFDWESLDPTRLEDGEPLARWRALEAIARFGTETDRDDTTSFVGRADELDLLHRIFSRAARDREPQLVMIMGEPGAGKSRLVREFAGWLDGLTESVIWRQGRCLPYGDGITFWAIAEIVKAHAGILETDPADAVRAKLDASVEQAIDIQDRRWVASQLGPLVGSGSDGGPLEQGEVFAAWRRFFEGISDSGPLVVVLEDLHWADPALLAFIEQLVDDAIDAPIMVLGTARPELREQRAAFGGDLRSLAWVPLPALTDTETSQLVSDILGTSVVPVDVQEALLSRAAGNPLFAEQFASLLLERGVLSRKGGSFVLADGVDIPVPDNVTAIISARLDTLAPERKRLLLDAAVVGKVFWTSVLEQLTGRPREAISQDLRELSHRGLIRRARRSSVGSDEESSFGHVLTRDTAYAQIPRAELGNKHLAVADWLEHLSGERKVDQADLLAHHLAEAYELSARPEALRGRMQRALVDAGRHLQRFDLVAAASRFERALEVTPDDDPARLTLMTELGRCLTNSGDAIRGIEMMQDVRTAAEAAGRRDVRARVGVHLARMWLFNGEAERSREELREATGSLSHIPSHRERAELWASAAMVRSHDGDPSTALAWADIAMDQLGNDDEPFTKAVILEVRGGALADMGDERGNADGREAVEILREAGAVVERGRAISELAFSLLATEGPTSAIPVMVEGLEVCARAGVSSAEANLRENIGNAMIDAGRWDDALEHIEWQYGNAERTGLARVRVGADVDTLGMTLARGGPLPASPEDLIEEARKFQDPLVPTFSDRIAGSLLAKGDIAGARRVLTLAAERIGDFALAVRTIRLPDYLRVCHALGDAELASALVRGLELPSAPRMRAAITTGRATLAEIEDRPDAAVTGYLEAIPLWDAAGCVVESAHAHAGLGRALLTIGRGTDGREHLLQARETFISLGATRWTAGVDGLLGDAAQASL